MYETYYEVHAEHDGHVFGSYDRQTAEEYAERMGEEMGQDHSVVAREEDR